MKYLCLMEQSEDGCDYSIGCGVRSMVVEADNSDAALGIVMAEWSLDEEDVLVQYGEGEEQELKEWKLYEIASERDLMPLVVSARRRSDKERAQESRKAELEVLAKLKKKYETT